MEGQEIAPSELPLRPSRSKKKSAPWAKEPVGGWVEGYDHGTARAVGLEPDESGHWPSRVPSGVEEGLILKATDHPTFWKTVEAEKEEGMEWYYKPSTKRWYTLRKGARQVSGRGFQKGMVRRKPEEGRDYQKPEQPGQPEVGPEPFVRPRRRPGYDRRGRRIREQETGPTPMPGA